MIHNVIQSYDKLLIKHIKKSYDSTIDRHLISFHNYCRHLLNDCLEIDLFFFLEIQSERKI